MQGIALHFQSRDRRSGLGVEERPVVSDNPLPGDEYWPTQPFPVKPKPLARNTFSASEVAKVTPEHECCKGLLDLEGGAMTGGPCAQCGPKLPRDLSRLDGRRNWNGGAYDAALGLLFLPTQDHGMLNKMVKSGDGYVRRGRITRLPDWARTGTGSRAGRVSSRPGAS